MVGDNYYPNTRNTTNFTVNRYNMDINLDKLELKSYTYLGNVTDYLEIKGSLREIRPYLAFHNEAYIYYDSEEYMGIKGKSKACIKINGKTVMDENDKAKYWNIQDGKIDIRMAIPENTIVKRVMIVVGERQAYTECKLETNFTTDMLCSQSNVHYSYNKQKKILQIYKESYEGYEDKKIYKNIYDTKNLALVLHEPIFQYCDVFKGTFSFFDEKGFIENGKRSYFSDSDYYIVECPYEYDGKNHEIKVKYSYPNTHYFDIQYNVTIKSTDSLYVSNMITEFAPNFSSEYYNNYRPMEFLPNYMDEFAIQTNFKYDKFILTINNKTQTFTNMDKKLDSEDYFKFNLTLPSKYGKYDIKLVFYDKNNKILLKKMYQF